ncbi:MAG: DUF222 domain-containing protein, partial [Thermobispora bispora]|nr:DUF222 domain-containing protein [Thermobispora bispora]
MDLFDVDHGRSRRSDEVDGEWWNRLIAGSPLWSSNGPLAREDCRFDLFSTSSPATDNPAPRTGSGRRNPAVAGAFGTALFTGGTRGGVTDTGVAEGFGSTHPGQSGGTDDPGARSASSSAGQGGDTFAGGRPLGGECFGGEGSGADAGAGAVGGGAAAGAGADAGATADAAGGVGGCRGRSSWVLIESAWEAVDAVALTPILEDAGICMAEAERLMAIQDRVSCALSQRVGRVHQTGEVKQHGHASTRSWLRTTGGKTIPSAGRLLTLAVELARLPKVREAFTNGSLAAGLVEAICRATTDLTDEQATLAEPILLELAGKAGPEEVAKAGRYLRAVLDPDGEERDEHADYTRRFLRVRPGRGGGMEGEFYLPREAAARLRALLDAYAKPKAEGDDRPLRVRNADAFIALLEDKIATELLVLVSAESLPADPAPDPETAPETGRSEAAHAEQAEGTGGSDNAEDTKNAKTDRPEQAHPETGDFGDVEHTEAKH